MRLINLILTCFFFFTFFSVQGQNLKHVQTTANTRWVWQADKKFSKHESGDLSILKIDPEKTFQTIDGFGAAFSELGWKALGYLPGDEQKKVMKAVFDTLNGCKFTICRIPIGANDFAKDYYSHNDNFFDYEMNDFNIERDKQNLIPYIKLAMEHNPDLKIWASPWTPPIWMKKNRHYGGRATNDTWGPLYGDNMKEVYKNNRIVDDEKTFTAYADYFVKFIEAYREEGINLYAIQPQNEVFANQLFPSCVWEAGTLADFMANYLMPAVEANSPETEIWLGTMNNDSIEYIDEIFELRPEIRNVTGFGVQWAGIDMMDDLDREYPTYKIMQTESECNNGLNNWFTAEHTFGLLHQSFTNGANSYMYWNLILDEMGLSTWMWRQNSMITIDKFTREVRYNPEFFVMKHFSHFIQPGAKRIATEGKIGLNLAFQNPDGSTVLIIGNSTEEKLETTILYENKFCDVEIESHSVSTFVIE